MADLWSRLGRLLLYWTLVVTAAGAALYGLVVGFLFLLPDLSSGELVLALPLAAGAAGAIAGLAQQRLIRPYWDVPRGWVWATALGWVGGLLLAVGLSLALRPYVNGWPDSYRLTAYLAATGTAGVLSALGTWRYLRRITFRHPWWLLANGVGWFMAWIVVLAFGLFLGGGGPLPATPDRLADALILGGSAGFVVGFEQGIALIGLLAQSAWEKARGRPRDQVQFNSDE